MRICGQGMYLNIWLRPDSSISSMNLTIFSFSLPCPPHLCPKKPRWLLSRSASCWSHGPPPSTFMLFISACLINIIDVRHNDMFWVYVVLFWFGFWVVVFEDSVTNTQITAAPRNKHAQKSPACFNNVCVQTQTHWVRFKQVTASSFQIQIVTATLTIQLNAD